MRGSPRLARLIAALALTAVACGGSGTTTSQASTSTITTSASTTTIAASTPSTFPPDVAADVDLPRQGVFAHVEFTLTNATYSNLPPGTYFESDNEPSEERRLFIEFTADFEDGYPGRSEEFGAGDFALVLADGTEIISDQVHFRRTIRVTNDGPLQWALAFPGQGFDLNDAAIRFDDQSHVPFAIALTGPISDDPFPVEVSVDGTAEDVAYEGGCGSAAGTAELLGAEWDVDAGVDQDGDTMVTAGTARAQAGELFLRTEVRAIGVAGTCGGTVFGSDAFRLVIDGLPVGPENRFTTLLKNGEGVDVIWGFRVPADTEAVALEAGLSDDTNATFPIGPPPSTG